MWPLSLILPFLKKHFEGYFKFGISISCSIVKFTVHSLLLWSFKAITWQFKQAELFTSARILGHNEITMSRRFRPCFSQPKILTENKQDPAFSGEPEYLFLMNPSIFLGCDNETWDRSFIKYHCSCKIPYNAIQNTFNISASCNFLWCPL